MNANKTPHKPKIGLVANEIHHGLCYQRGHIFMRELRDKYDFVLLSQFELEKCHPFYFDALVVFHPYNNQNELLIKRAQAQYGIPVIVDVDDLITHLTSDHPDFGAFQNNKIKESIMFADHYVTSTDYLAKFYGDLNKNITVIENVVDPRRYKGIDHGTKPYHAGFVVGWTGSQSHRPDLYNTGFAEGLARAMREHDDIRAYFHILCPQPLLDEFGARVIFNPTPVDFLDYPALCFTFPFDVCAVPLYDSPFNDAKSDLRLLDMAPFKIPCIASPRHEFVRHRGTERLLLVEEESADGWHRAISGAYKDQPLLQRVAETAHQYVLNHRTSLDGSRKWDEVFQKVLSQNN